MHFNYMTYYGHALALEPLPGGHKDYNFGRPFLGHHQYKLILSDLPFGSREDFLRYTLLFLNILQEIISLWAGGHEI